MAYNRSKILKKIASKEIEIDQGVLGQLPSEALILLRNELENLNSLRVAQINDSIIPEEPSDIHNALSMILAEEYNNVLNDQDNAVFEVKINEDEDQDVENLELSPQNNLDVEEGIDVMTFRGNVWKRIEKLAITGSENLESVKDKVLPMISEYFNALEMNVEEQPDSRYPGDYKKVKVVDFTNTNKEITDQIFNVLQFYELAGYSVGEKSEDSHNNIGDTTMASKKFNLKKHAEKVYDTLRERDIMHDDLQYLTRHPKTIKEYEEVYIGDYLWQNSVMDKYYTETQDPKTGEYVGGYINDRFHTHVNTEGNSMRARPDGKYPDRPESYSTERRLEELREDGTREYTPTEGSETEQQNKIVASSNFNFTKDAGLNKVSFNGKVIYLDTDDDLEIFKRLAQVTPLGVVEPQSSEKKNSVENNISQPATNVNPYFEALGNLDLIPDHQTFKAMVQDITAKLTGPNTSPQILEAYQKEAWDKFIQTKSLEGDATSHASTDMIQGEPGTQDEVNETARGMGL
jgi:hypothetical protein